MQTTEDGSAGVRVLKIRPWIDLAPYLDDFDLLSLSIGPSGELYALAITTPTDFYTETLPGGGRLFKALADHPHVFRILRFDGRDIRQIDIRGQRWNFFHVQPLPNDQLLLVVGRSRRYSDDLYDRNASVFSSNGELQRQFLLGDGIGDVQATADGSVWVSYFDEGIWGRSNGWKEQIGRSGLALWDQFGNRLYEFSPLPELGISGRMTDCCALNVVSDNETWCYYFNTDPRAVFPLVRLQREQIKGVWLSPIYGAKAIALWENYVLFAGRFRKRDEWNLLKFDGCQMHHLLRFNAVDEQQNILQPNRVTARGSTVCFIQGSQCYRLEVRDIAEAL